MNFTEQLETATSLSGVSPEKSIEIFQSILNSEQLSKFFFFHILSIQFNGK